MNTKGSPRNVSKIRAPRCSGRDGEYAVVVSRGEPRRDDEQMLQWVTAQISVYLDEYTDLVVGPELVTGTAARIATDYIAPYGSQAVTLNRELLLWYVQAQMTAGMNETGGEQ